MILYLIFAWVFGLLAFFVLPVASSLTARMKWPARFAGSMAMRIIGRAAMVVSEHDEIVFKRMSYKDTGVERIVFGSEKKDFNDPWAALSHWKGFPFALADEVTGTLFDPRHAAFGTAFRQAVQAGNVDKNAEPDGQHAFDVTSWGPGIVELPGTYELVDLSGVRALVDGGERAEFPQRVENLYEYTREPFESDRPSLRIFLPIGALLACVFAMWFLAAQTGGSGEGGGGTTVGFGSLALAGLAAVSTADIKRALAPMLTAIVAIAAFGLLVVGLGPIWGFLIAFSFVMGFVFVPFIALATMWIGPVSGAFGDLFLRMFLLGFSRPVWVWSPTGYDVVEAETLEDPEDVHWYRLKGQLVGFTYEPEESSFGPEWTEPSTVEALQGANDSSSAPAVPSGWAPSEQLTIPPYGAMVPERVDQSSIYVDVRTIVRRIADAATGDKTLQRLLLAKEKHGSNNRSMGDQTLLMWTVGCALFGLGFGWVVFF